MELKIGLAEKISKDELKKAIGNCQAPDVPGSWDAQGTSVPHTQRWIKILLSCYITRTFIGAEKRIRPFFCLKGNKECLSGLKKNSKARFKVLFKSKLGFSTFLT